MMDQTALNLVQTELANFLQLWLRLFHCLSLTGSRFFSINPSVTLVGELIVCLFDGYDISVMQQGHKKFHFDQAIIWPPKAG